MHRQETLLALAGTFLLALALIPLTACVPREDGGNDAARDTEWNELRTAHEELTTRRQELTELREKIEQGAGALSEEELQGMSPEEAHLKLQQSADEMEQEIYSLADDFSPRLVDFINADPPLEGESLNEIQLAAVQMKTGEDIEYALDHIKRGGDYGKAISILEGTLRIDPDNERRDQELEKAKALRYMTEERFAMVKNGMSQDEVRATLGQVLHHNVRDYPDQGVMAWFYPKEGGSAAAAVFFRKRRQGADWTVYKRDFNAVEQRIVEGGEG